ncbi:hypothetical protein D1627_08425 [Pontibacter oryzae]|uniref:Lipoprotein n=1 Tax=Pontibacter oryzae TaxID=2304593 RepID=A0A399SHL6_9BACT|nr:hypothetical protein D1627_08425 [Pontibacter oryzae]
MNPCRPLSENTLSRKEAQPTTWLHFIKHSVTKQAGTALLCALLLHSSCSQKQEAEAANLEISPTVTTAQPDSAANPVMTAPETDAVAEAPSIKEADPWEYPGPKPTPGAVLPQKRIIAFYGNPLSRRMGILGELPPDQMLAKLDEEVQHWEAADSLTPVQPALHAIVVTAQGKPGRAGKYRLRMTNKMIDDVLAMAKKRDAIVFLDIQVGQSTLQEELPQLAEYLKMPQVHLGIDAEFSMKNGGVPGRSIGSFDAEDINFATEYLAELAQENQLPPKLLIVHRFTQGMITNHDRIKLRPEVQVVMHMDGWGHPALKKDTYRRYIQKEPVQFTGFKVFYKNDLRKSPRLMSPDEILALDPKPLYIQYQ